MNAQTLSWLALATSVLIVVGYELRVLHRSRTRPWRTARSANARMRTAWLEALSGQPGTEILAVQTLRNSLMSATIVGSTSALALMGSISLTTPSLAHDASQQLVHAISPALALRLLMWASLFASLVCSAMAMRSYNHAGYAASMPVGSPQRARYKTYAAAHLERAGLLYSWSVRSLLFVAPVIAGLVSPLASPLASLALVAALIAVDRMPELAEDDPPAAAA